MKKTVLVLLGVAAVSSTLVMYSCSDNAEKKSEEKSTTKEADKPEDVIAKGQHLVTIMGCNDCHSPKKMGPQGPEIIPNLLLSGYPADRSIAKLDSKLIKEDFSMFYPDLTATAAHGAFHLQVI